MVRALEVTLGSYWFCLLVYFHFFFIWTPILSLATKYSPSNLISSTWLYILFLYVTWKSSTLFLQSDARHYSSIGLVGRKIIAVGVRISRVLNWRALLRCKSVVMEPLSARAPLGGQNRYRNGRMKMDYSKLCEPLIESKSFIYYLNSILSI